MEEFIYNLYNDLMDNVINTDEKIGNIHFDKLADAISTLLAYHIIPKQHTNEIIKLFTDFNTQRSNNEY